MTPEATLRTDALFAKAKLTVSEMGQLIAAHASDLPSVRSVSLGEDGEIAVALVGGLRIEVQAIPVAHAFNESLETRRRALGEVLKRCA